jgi:hypothetical protein
MVSFTARPLYPRERASGTHRIGSWVDPRPGLDDVENRKFFTLPGLEIRPLCHPALSQSLYRLRHPGSSPISVFSQMLGTELIYCICYGVSSSVCDVDRYVILESCYILFSANLLYSYAGGKFLHIHTNISSVMLPTRVVTYTGS